VAPQEEVRDLILVEGRIRCFVTPAQQFEENETIEDFRLKAVMMGHVTGRNTGVRTS
jgi:hypothetical protein